MKTERDQQERYLAGESPAGSGRGYSRRVFIGRSAGVALAVGGIGGYLGALKNAAAATGAARDERGSGEVVVMAWTVYLTPAIQKRFHDVTGITLKAIPAADDQTMFTKVKAGGSSQYDIVFANCGWTPIYHQNGLTEVLDLTTIPAAKDLWPVFKQDTKFPFVIGANQTLLYPNMWSATAMIWNTTAPWQPPKPYSWNDLWKAPKGKVILHGAPEDFIAMTGLARGIPGSKVYSMDGSTLDATASYLKKLKPFQISPNSDAVTAGAIASKKAYIGFASSLGIAYKANTQFAHGKDVARTVIPKEGTLGWVDGPQLVKGAKNRDNALKFLDFWGSDPWLQKYLWDQYYFAQCSRVSTQHTLARGGKTAQIARSLGADKPQLAQKLTFLAPPKDPAAWSAAWDDISS